MSNEIRFICLLKIFFYFQISYSKTLNNSSMQYWIQQYKLPTDQVHTSLETLKLLQSIRWHQTANRGYVPNSDLPNTFMAVALDTFDPLVDDWRGGKT